MNRNNEMHRSNLRWFHAFEKIGFDTFLVTYFNGKVPQLKLIDLLQLNKVELSPFSKDLMESDDLPKYLQNQIDTLTLGFWAYLQFQDILPLTIKENIPVSNRHYCYYESIIYLKESVLTWLNSNVLGAITLIRPFLELSISHIYWHIHFEFDSYQGFYDWLNNEKNTGKFKTALPYIFKNLPNKKYHDKDLLNSIKESLDSSYRNLNSYNHGLKLNNSLTADARGNQTVGHQLFLYSISLLNDILLNTVKLYCFAYPMILFPLKKYEKWGFSYPVGIYADHCNYRILEKYIGKKDIGEIKVRLAEAESVKSLLDHYNNLPTVDDDYIEKSWIESRKESNDSFQAKTLIERLAHVKAEIRSMNWSFNYIKNQELFATIVK